MLIVSVILRIKSVESNWLIVCFGKWLWGCENGRFFLLNFINFFVILCIRNYFKTIVKNILLVFVNFVLKIFLLVLIFLSIYNWLIIYKKVFKMVFFLNGY